MVKIHPREIAGTWDQGYVLDVHTISSTMIGYNEFGHAEFDTVRSPLGELVYRLKYRADKSVVPSIVETAAKFVKEWDVHPSAVLPVPPSKLRSFQPVIEIASQLAKLLGIVLDKTTLKKTQITSQMKDVGDFGSRVAALEAAFTSSDDLKGREILLVDDLFQSGATMNVGARCLKEQGLVKAVYALALTRTRN